MAISQLQNFFVGTYSIEGPYIPEAKGEGILSLSLNPNSGEIHKLAAFSGKINSTYLTKNSEYLFVVCDNFEKFGEVKAFAIDGDCSLKLLSTQCTSGTSSCHIEYDPWGERIITSSYGSGTISSHSFNGKYISPNPQLLFYKGHGPNKERQEAPHLHQAVISPDGKWLYACDLGSDKIWCHDLSNPEGEIKKIEGISTPAGSGPRHLLCHPELPMVYVFCELTACILTFLRDDETGSLSYLTEDLTLPLDYNGIPAGAAISLHPSLRTLYVSNRNHNSITVFSLNKRNGRLKYESTFSTKGEEPRDFSIDPTGQWLLVANQNYSNIISFHIDPQSGLPSGRLGSEFYCGTPVCILFEN